MKGKKMGLNESKGNMYDWVTHTWNPVKGQCPHGCSYCYMKRWGTQKPVRLDLKELKTDLGTGNFIFVGSSCDLFARDIPEDWIRATLSHCEKFDSKYLFQTKNPQRFLDFIDAVVITDKSVLCTTIETNRRIPGVMWKCPDPYDRALWMRELEGIIETYVTIEPIMDFDLLTLVDLIEMCHPKQVNIGADTGHNHLPEPGRDKILALIEQLNQFTTVKEKSNLKRLL